MVNLGNRWDELLADQWQQPYYRSLRKKLVAEYRTRAVCPAPEDLFNALKAVDYPEVRVVLLGQDPYHGPGQAHGFSFSVLPGVAIPPSLQNIYKEMATDLQTQPPEKGDLRGWAAQGVLLLNTVLSVRQGMAHSHRNWGWETLTDRILQLLNEAPQPIVYLLWGRPARQKKALIRNPRHLVLEAAHPSPLSAHNGFFGCRHFSQTNAFLAEHGAEPIDWTAL